MKAYGLAQELSEGIVLYRTYHALRDLQRPIYFVNYDRWWSEPVRQLESLAAHCGLANPTTDYAAVMRANVRAELNREAGSELELSASLEDLDRLFADCNGADYDAKRITSWCNGLTKSIEDLHFAISGVERLYLEHGPRLFRPPSKTRNNIVSRILGGVRRRIRD